MFDRARYKFIGKDVANQFMDRFWIVSLLVILLCTGGLISANYGFRYSPSEYVNDSYLQFTYPPGELVNASYLQVLWVRLPLLPSVAAILVLVFTGVAILCSPLTYGEKTLYMYTLNYDAQIHPAPSAKLPVRHALNHYTKFLATEIIWGIKIFLWSLLFIIPGIIKFYEYRLIPYLIAMHPDMSFSEAQSISSSETEGHKADLFIMDLSFILWELLSALTAGILDVVWLRSYREASFAAWVTDLNLDEKYYLH